MLTLFLILQLLILTFSIVIHEVAHGEVANFLGDPTAKNLGRLTLNPIKHIDPLGSIVVPLLTFLLQTGIIIGWAKPVPYNPNNLRNQRVGPALVGLAGPATNLSVALIFGLIARFLPIATNIKQQIGYSVVLARDYDSALTLIGGSLLYGFFAMAILITFINILLALFNLIPIPPLDGSKLLYLILPHSMGGVMETLERFGFVLVLFVIFLIGPVFFSIVLNLYSFIVGF
ncbi:MAG: site-2 protease family protein [Patescibacteria group bacterium]